MPIPRKQVKSATIKAETEQVEKISEQLDILILASGDNSKQIWLDINVISDHVLEELTKRYEKAGWIVQVFPGSGGKTQIQLK